MAYRFVLAALACLLSLSSPLTALSAPTLREAQEQKKPIRWPESDRPQLRYTAEEISFDGGIIRVGHLVGPTINWETNFPLHWDRTENTDGRFSLLLRYKNDAQVFFAISVFDETELLPDLAKESWSRLKTGLGEGKEDFTIQAETSSLEEDGEGPYIMSNPTRTILYSWTGARLSRNAEFDIFFKDGKTLIAFRLIGPLDSVKAQIGEFTRRSTQIGEWRWDKK